MPTNCRSPIKSKYQSKSLARMKDTILLYQNEKVLLYCSTCSFRNTNGLHRLFFTEWVMKDHPWVSASCTKKDVFKILAFLKDTQTTALFMSLFDPLKLLWAAQKDSCLDICSFTQKKCRSGKRHAINFQINHRNKTFLNFRHQKFRQNF